MKFNLVSIPLLFHYSFVLLLLATSCENNDEGTNAVEQYLLEKGTSNTSEDTTEEVSTPPETPDSSILPNIDLSHWKVTLPINNAISVSPPEILDYANNDLLTPFMFNDEKDGSLVFYTYPDASTPNSSYSRTELREQMVPGSNNTNWTFRQGGRLSGTLAVPEISTDQNGTPHRVIVMQIHGRLTDAQRELIGQGDNNAPPMLKIYWDNGSVRVKTKEVKDLSDTTTELLHKDAWGDDEGYTFPEPVGTDKFKLEVLVSDGRMDVILNETDSISYDNIHIQKWGIFENYFKAGNYLQTQDNTAFSRVKFYKLDVSHN